MCVCVYVHIHVCVLTHIYAPSLGGAVCAVLNTCVSMFVGEYMSDM